MGKKKQKRFKVPMNGRTYVCARGHAMQATVTGDVWLEQDGIDNVLWRARQYESRLDVYCEGGCKFIGSHIKEAFTRFLEGVLY